MHNESNESQSPYLDDEWIVKFESLDKPYKDFYKDDIYYTNIHFFYVNRNNDIDKIKQELFLFSKPNVITREEVIGLLKKYSFDNDKRYTLLSILKYNVTLNENDVTDYLYKHNNNNDDNNYNSDNNNNDDNINDVFLTKITNIDAISFEKSISMFHDVNDLLFVFFEKSTELKKNNNTITKKIYLHSNHMRKNMRKKMRKTIKKQYKD